MFKTQYICLTISILALIGLTSCDSSRYWCISRTRDLNVSHDVCNIEGGAEKVYKIHEEQKRLRGQKALDELNDIGSKQPKPVKVIIDLIIFWKEKRYW